MLRDLKPHSATHSTINIAANRQMAVTGGYASGQSRLTVNQFLRVREFKSHSTNSGVWRHWDLLFICMSDWFLCGAESN